METQTMSDLDTTVLVRDEGPSPQFIFVDGGGEPKKLKLAIRKLAFMVELSRIHLPKDDEQLLHMALSLRQLTIENRYRLVCIWVRLKQKGKPFWKRFKCGSPAELLSKLSLPSGKTLGDWEGLVRTFDKETFLLVGDELLGYMAYQISRYQKNVSKQRADYEEIFRAYCAKYDAFDADSFCDMVHWYVNTRYEGHPPTNPFNPPPTPYRGKKGRKHVFVAPEPEEPEPRSEPEPSDDQRYGFRHTETLCAGCKERDMWHIAAMRHIEGLEDTIRTNLGPKFVPPRPKILEMYPK